MTRLTQEERQLAEALHFDFERQLYQDAERVVGTYGVPLEAAKDAWLHGAAWAYQRALADARDAHQRFFEGLYRSVPPTPAPPEGR